MVLSQERKQLPLFLGLAFLIAWSFWVPMALHRHGVISFAIPLLIGQSAGAYAPLLALMLMERTAKDQEIIRSAVKRVKWQGYLRPNLSALLVPPAVVIGANLTRQLAEASYPISILQTEPAKALGAGLILVIPIQFMASFFSSPLGEEPGWRGFALSRLHKRLGSWRGSLLLGTLWWVWHVPLFFALGIAPTLYSYLAILGHSFLIDRLYIESGRNLLPAMLCHQSINTSITFLYGGFENGYAIAVLWGYLLVSQVVFPRFYRKKVEPELPS